MTRIVVDNASATRYTVYMANTLTQAQTTNRNKRQHDHRTATLQAYAGRKGTAQDRRNARRSKRGVIFGAKAVAETVAE